MKQGKPTMADIARLSGVSQSTVSLVLNQKGSRAIPLETAERVLAAARAAGKAQSIPFWSWSVI